MFSAKDLKVEFSSEAIESMLACRQSHAKDRERGGILMGELYPAKNKIIVKMAYEISSENPGRYRYEMNVAEANSTMKTIWKKSGKIITYLGDWHTHPQVNPTPSYSDKWTFSKNFYETNPPHKLMLYTIVGTDDSDKTKCLWNGVCQGLRTKRIHLLSDHQWGVSN